MAIVASVRYKIFVKQRGVADYMNKLQVIPVRFYLLELNHLGISGDDSQQLHFETKTALLKKTCEQI